MDKTIKRNLVVTLSEEEISACAKELARVTTQQAEIEEEKKVAASSYKEKLDRCVSESRSLARKISTRQDFREVECVWTNDYSGRQAILHRMDTWDEVERRKLTMDEVQLSLLEDEQPADWEQENPPAVVEPVGQVAEPVEQDSDEAHVCLIADCEHHDKSQPNGCAQLEYVEECDRQAVVGLGEKLATARKGRSRA